MIDLGLPSGTKWACCNVGASTPEGYGNYYAWGETEAKSEYSWSTYKYYSSTFMFTKYWVDVDNKTELEASDDVATCKWGSPWCMPKGEEISELQDYCKWTWQAEGNTEYNSVAGYKVTGTNGNSIFLPAAGSGEGPNISGHGLCAYYWSSSTDSYWNTWFLHFFKDCIFPMNCSIDRHVGYSVRPVQY